MERDFLARRNRFLLSEFYLVMETVTDIIGSQFLKKDYISTNGN